MSKTPVTREDFVTVALDKVALAMNCLLLSIPPGPGRTAAAAAMMEVNRAVKAVKDPQNAEEEG